jgi:DNA-directed RNA polymerase specialized sigma24 family protein
MVVRDYVDFSAVHPQHQAVDERLHNWARWARGGRGAALACSPMFRLYRPPQHWRQHVEAGVTVDSTDALAMQRLVAALPQLHRLALAWCYVVDRNPKRAAQDLGLSMRQLMDTIHIARQMLVARGA